jgi:hypothetical protein
MQLHIANLVCLIALAVGSSAYIHGDNHPVRRDGPGLGAAYPQPSSIAASVTGSKGPNATAPADPHDYPTLGAPLDDAAIASISAQDKSFDKEISSVMSVASASLPCKAVTDVSGSPVTICAPTQAMATLQGSAAGNAGGKAMGLAAVAALAAVLLQ